MRSVKGLRQSRFILHFHKWKAGKGRMEEAFIQSEETVAVLEGMSADQKIGKDAAWSWIAILSSSRRGSLKRAACGSPH